MDRAYSLLTVKSVQEDQRIIRGVATTPEPDRIGDIVEPLGVQFKNPMPLLWHHQTDKPVGHVKFDKPTKDGITFEAKLPVIDEPGTLRDRVNEAWQSIKAGLVAGVSIGFRALEHARLESGGLRFLKSEVLELSLVTVPAHAGASITQIKSLDTEQRQAASGHSPHRVVRLDPPGASGKRNSTPIKPKEATDMTTLSEQIVALETKRAAHVAAQHAVMQKSIDAGRSSEQAEQEEFDNLDVEVDAIDKDLTRLRKLEKTMAVTAKPIVKAATEEEGSEQRSHSFSVKALPKLDPGIAWTQLVKVKMAARLDHERPLDMAARMYGADSQVVNTIKVAVVAGSTTSGNWAADLVGAEGSAFADFAEFLRADTILGKFGTNGIPNLRRVPFRQPMITQTGGGTAYWVGEGKPKPLTSFNFDRTTIEPLKIANIAVVTEENIRDSSPKSDVIIRDALRDAIVEGQDLAFIDPTNAGSAGVKPAAITNGASTIGSTGIDADDVRLDIRALLHVYTAAHNKPRSAVWIMSSDNAIALSMMVNTLGQPEFPGLSMDGGRFNGYPVIVSDHVGSIAALVNASDVFLADDGGIQVDMSREASLEMLDGSLQQNALTGTGASLVSMFQTNSVALRAEHTINWKRRRASAVAYLTGVVWGAELPTV